MDIVVFAKILGKRPGDIVREDDKDYAQFRAWAENKDRRGGIVICEFAPSAVKAERVEAEEPEGETEKSYKCEHEGCDFVTKSAPALKMHIGKYHKPKTEDEE